MLKLWSCLKLYPIFHWLLNKIAMATVCVTICVKWRLLKKVIQIGTSLKPSGWSKSAHLKQNFIQPKILLSSCKENLISGTSWTYCHIVPGFTRTSRRTFLLLLCLFKQMFEAPCHDIKTSISFAYLKNTGVTWRQFWFLCWKLKI